MANLLNISIHATGVCLRRLSNFKGKEKILNKLNSCVFMCAVSSANKFANQRRHLSQYVQGVRHLQKLKEDDNFCRESWTSGKFAVIYDSRPVLVPSTEEKKPWGIAWKTANELAETLKDDFLVQESVVLNCNSSDPTGPPKFAINISAKPEPDHKRKFEEAIKGSAVSGRKAFFIVSKTDARILSQLSPVAIVLITNGDSCLVVRQPKFMGGMYSAISGFFDQGESLDAAVRREVAEEVGLEVDEVRFFSSQSWAYPVSSIMLGCHARLKPGTTDQVSLEEAELEDSRWLHRDEVLAILSGGNAPGQELWFPPSMAIGHHLLKSWATQE